jgi:hypothetical protein
MEFRVVEDEYEAKLSPLAGQTGTGRVERKRYGDPVRTVAPGDTAELRCDGQAVANGTFVEELMTPT